jgi:hypothetical protein
VTPATAAHAHAAASRRLSREIAAALRRVFPQDVAFSLTAQQRMGKITVKLETLFQDPEQAQGT